MKPFFAYILTVINMVLVVSGGLFVIFARDHWVIGMIVEGVLVFFANLVALAFADAAVVTAKAQLVRDIVDEYERLKKAPRKPRKQKSEDSHGV